MDVDIWHGWHVVLPWCCLCVALRTSVHDAHCAVAEYALISLIIYMRMRFGE
jgi:hypothetical protein